MEWREKGRSIDEKKTTSQFYIQQNFHQFFQIRSTLILHENVFKHFVSFFLRNWSKNYLAHRNKTARILAQKYLLLIVLKNDRKRASCKKQFEQFPKQSKLSSVRFVRQRKYLKKLLVKTQFRNSIYVPYFFNLENLFIILVIKIFVFFFT